jgi:hypothetical protein
MTACVVAERSEVLEAKAELERCQAERSEADPECLSLAERLKTLQRNYEARARQAWGCDPAQEECPTPR